MIRSIVCASQINYQFDLSFPSLPHSIVHLFHLGFEPAKKSLRMSLSAIFRSLSFSAWPSPFFVCFFLISVPIVGLSSIAQNHKFASLGPVTRLNSENNFQLLLLFSPLFKQLFSSCRHRFGPIAGDVIAQQIQAFRFESIDRFGSIGSG